MAALPNEKRVTLLKSLLTSACERNCFYCAFRSGRDTRRVTFRPDEMARNEVQLTSAGVIQGAFISSAIAGGGVRTQDRLLDTADILRNKLNYRGYLHLKIMPGAEDAQIERAMQLADRVSVNLERRTYNDCSSWRRRKIYSKSYSSRSARWRRSAAPAQGTWDGKDAAFEHDAVRGWRSWRE
jgi:predicted DNA-binding helix-hairpin-helix protein